LAACFGSEPPRLFSSHVDRVLTGLARAEGEICGLALGHVGRAGVI
jgi:hypothetical protein